MRDPRTPLAFAAIALAVCLPVSIAHAEGPMATDDAGTLDKGGMKVEGVWSKDDQTRGGTLGFGYGPIENVEIGIAFARETDRAADPSTRLRGRGIALKWVPIQNETGWSLGASFAYGQTRVNERATPDRFTEKEYALAGLATYRSAGGYVLHANLGTARVEVPGARDRVGTWGIGAEFRLQERLQLTAETFGAEHARPDKAIGLRYEVFEGFKVSAAAGRGNGRSFAQLGVAWEF